MWPVISVRRQSDLLSAGAVVGYLLVWFLPFRLLALALLWGLALAGLSLLIRCPQCRAWAFRRRMRLLGETWTIPGGWLPPQCITCGQDFGTAYVVKPASGEPPVQRSVERRNPRKTVKLLLLCAAASSAGGVAGWVNGDLRGALAGFAVASMWLLIAIAWHVARR